MVIDAQKNWDHLFDCLSLSYSVLTRLYLRLSKKKAKFIEYDCFHIGRDDGSGDDKKEKVKSRYAD